MPRLPQAFEDDKARLIASLKPAAKPAGGNAADGSAPRAKVTAKGNAFAKTAVKKTPARAKKSS